MKLTKQEQDVIWRKFCVYCIKVMDGEALYYFRELKKLQEREVCFSDFIPEERLQLCTYDESPDLSCFRVMGMDIPIKDDGIGDALSSLPERKRMIILMTFFLDMTEKEIAEYLNLVQSTVHYHKAESLRLLKEIMEKTI